MPGCLDAADRDFFRLLAEAAACNPFGDRYPEILRVLAGCDASVSADECMARMEARMNERVARLQAAGAATVRGWEADDREIIRAALLFHTYWRFITPFDEVIVEQVDAGDRAVRVPFAGEVLATLAQRGFADEDARRYVAIVYQVRRAFFFIDRGLVGRSACMKELRRRLWNNVFTHDMRLYERLLWNRMEDFSTLLLGETGTGKGAAAAAIGRSGFIPFDEQKNCFAESFMRAFLALNLSQFPETLIESELFGHRKGAFTGAVDTHEGVFARCSPHGAIFLDEIGDVSIPVQTKLLQVLQERTFSPVGGHDKQRFRGRVIAATNKPLDALRRGGQFRDDFFYRLCSDVVVVPPLRQRLEEEPGELTDLVALIVQRMIGEASPDIVHAVEAELTGRQGMRYWWPGNVRELEQAVRRIVLTRQYAGERSEVNARESAAALVEGREPGPEAVPASVASRSTLGLSSRLQAGIADGSLDADTLLAGYCRLLYERHGTYEDVARRARLDRRTAKAYIEKARTSLT
jgi:DNA-binding NtrC family response regulator